MSMYNVLSTCECLRRIAWEMNQKLDIINSKRGWSDSLEVGPPGRQTWSPCLLADDDHDFGSIFSMTDLAWRICNRFATRFWVVSDKEWQENIRCNNFRQIFNWDLKETD